MQLIVLLALLNALLVTDATKTGATKLIQNICDTLYSNQELHSGDDQKWETICEDLFGTKEHYEKNRQLRQSEIGKYQGSTFAQDLITIFIGPIYTFFSPVFRVRGVWRQRSAEGSKTRCNSHRWWYSHWWWHSNRWGQSYAVSDAVQSYPYWH